MPKHHSATITLKLPVGVDADTEIAALRAAGIPVDALGNAERGFLFVRFSNGWENRTNIFRWFAGSIEQDLRKSDIKPHHRGRVKVRERITAPACGGQSAVTALT